MESIDQNICNICCDKFTKNIRKEIICPYCNFKSCLVCFKTYLLNTNKSLPDCMSCHNNLSIDFINQHTPKSFYNNDYRNKRSEDLLSQEKSLLPITQHLVERVKKQENRYKEIQKLQQELKNINERKKQILFEINFLKHTNDETNDEEVKERKKFIMACPAPDCRGFLSSQYKCGTCLQYSCPTCREFKGCKDAEHICNNDTILTVKLLAEDTKSCPKCSSLIFKINGCDQMFCTECKTPFSWKTGLIVSGVIHNPHFYEWQRNINNGVAPRNPGDNPHQCNEGITPINIINQKLKKNNTKFTYFTNCYQLFLHIEHDEMLRFTTNEIQENEELRVWFLLNRISEQKWLSLLKMKKKKQEKYQQIYQILNMFIISGHEIFHSYITNIIENLETLLNNLKLYVNNELEKIYKIYNCSGPYINEIWRITTFENYKKELKNIIC